jgi:hypothetical protein
MRSSGVSFATSTRNCVISGTIRGMTRRRTAAARAILDMKTRLIAAGPRTAGGFAGFELLGVTPDIWGIRTNSQRPITYNNCYPLNSISCPRHLVATGHVHDGDAHIVTQKIVLTRLYELRSQCRCIWPVCQPNIGSGFPGSAANGTSTPLCCPTAAGHATSPGMWIGRIRTAATASLPAALPSPRPPVGARPWPSPR